jgi:hypothetical protein
MFLDIPFYRTGVYINYAPGAFAQAASRWVVSVMAIFRQLPADQWLHPGQKLLHADAEQQQCLVVLLHAVPFDFAHDQLP